MASIQHRLPLRPRAFGGRSKVDENANSRHIRQPSNGAASRLATNNAKVVQAGRVALSEVTTTAVNRRDVLKAAPKGKEDSGLKRISSSMNIATALPQRVPLASNVARVQPAPAVTNPVNARAPAIRAQRSIIPTRNSQRNSRVVAQPTVLPTPEEEEDVEIADVVMEIEPSPLDDDLVLDVGVDRDLPEDLLDIRKYAIEEDMEETARVDAARQHRRVWPDFPTEQRVRCAKAIQEIAEDFVDEVDPYDTTMVCEYAEEIFEYMERLEEESMPLPNYMDMQNEINWSMRQTLVDWLLQVHLRYHMLPETLWIAINLVDRFLSKRVVSTVKLQLVGVTAIFIAAKYEEILAPSVDEFLYMTGESYSKAEMLKGERIILQVLDFKVSDYCSPYSWMRKISKADDYDIQTRTLSKFLIEVTLLDYRFVPVKPSMVAAVGMYTARRMLGGEWDEKFVFYSGYTEEQLLPGHNLVIEKISEPEFRYFYVCKKYAHKKYLQAATFAMEWARVNSSYDDAMAM
ncbi:hypothetical protein HGRIS_003793 [Hohenbuehelia grisea]|uniref:Cyclin N-terminal domain-containing protein n=1 Tax=Hohenbuehelia grisea TaxID=104357 RepID=A0ABR3JGF2_9AGAR